jgi:hypothetical protein
LTANDRYLSISRSLRDTTRGRCPQDSKSTPSETLERRERRIGIPNGSAATLPTTQAAPDTRDARNGTLGVRDAEQRIAAIPTAAIPSKKLNRDQI